MFNVEERPETIDLNNVFLIKYINRRMYFHTLEHIYFLASTIKAMSSLMDDFGFIQIDKSLLINVNWIDDIKDDYRVIQKEVHILVNGNWYVVSRRKLASVRSTMHKRLR